MPCTSSSGGRKVVVCVSKRRRCVSDMEKEIEGEEASLAPRGATTNRSGLAGRIGGTVEILHPPKIPDGGIGSLVEL